MVTAHRWTLASADSKIKGSTIQYHWRLLAACKYDGQTNVFQRQRALQRCPFAIAQYTLHVFLNPLNADLNLICHLALLAHHIFHVSGPRVKHSFTKDGPAFPASTCSTSERSTWCRPPSTRSRFRDAPFAAIPLASGMTLTSHCHRWPVPNDTRGLQMPPTAYRVQAWRWAVKWPWHIAGREGRRDTTFRAVRQGLRSCCQISSLTNYHHHRRHLLSHIPETNYVPREYSVAAILLLLFMVLISLISGLNLFYLYISTFRSVCAVPNMAVFCSSLTSCFPGMLLIYFLNDFKIVPVAPIIVAITFVFTLHMRCFSFVRSLSRACVCVCVCMCLCVCSYMYKYIYKPM